MGCDLVLGLQHVDPPPPDAPGPVNTPHVSGTLQEHVVTNTAAPIVQRFYTAAELTLSVTLDDGTTPPITYDDTTGTFAFDRPAAGETYRLQIGTPDLGAFDYQLTTSSPTIGLRTFNRLDSIPVTQPTTVQFDYILFGGFDEFALLASTGVGSSTNPQQQDTGTFTFDWKQAVPLDGSIRLLAGGEGDLLYYNEMTTTGIDPYSYYSISQYASASVTMTDGSNQVIPARVEHCHAGHVRVDPRVSRRGARTPACRIPTVLHRWGGLVDLRRRVSCARSRWLAADRVCRRRHERHRRRRDAGVLQPISWNGAVRVAQRRR